MKRQVTGACIPDAPIVVVYPTVLPASTVAFTLIKFPAVPVLPSINCMLFKITLSLLLLLKLQFSLLPEVIRSLVCIIAPPVLITVIYFAISILGVGKDTVKDTSLKVNF